MAEPKRCGLGGGGKRDVINSTFGKMNGCKYDGDYRFCRRVRTACGLYESFQMGKMDYSSLGKMATIGRKKRNCTRGEGVGG